jgi:hypothetical protein
MDGVNLDERRISHCRDDLLANGHSMAVRLRGRENRHKVFRLQFVRLSGAVVRHLIDPDQHADEVEGAPPGPTE